MQLVPNKSETTIPAWQDAIENFLIGHGMGWDMEGLLQGLVDALPARARSI